MFFFNFDTFLKFLPFGVNLSARTQQFFCKKKYDFWYPWDPWGRVNSGVNGFWVHTATVLCTTSSNWTKYFLKYRYEIFLGQFLLKTNFLRTNCWKLNWCNTNWVPSIVGQHCIGMQRETSAQRLEGHF